MSWLSNSKNWDRSVIAVTGLRAGRDGIRIQEKEISFPFSKTPRSAQGPTQFPIHRVREFFPPWVQLHGSVDRITFVKTEWLGLMYEWFCRLHAIHPRTSDYVWLDCAHPNLLSCNSLNTAKKYGWARGGAVCWGTAIQPGRTRVRYLMAPLEFLIDLILAAALWPGGRLSL